ncbi:mitochondrial carrier protein-like protein rim2 [Pseudovirgaria hyperparasitica]|uniref:Mitochondrial carrier protein-like protein rim2 n=1 Tax=Pseudovirgaria hyperparasitica TaxID=470096 RepID=A0A6A6W359_9PEZI|nr:mitochondrial carrier protein-like protein rim2 [Pseudovirgaria hyperparasitica]KAF2757292.1 mitochondrial carrier protein-like protein rim2 [Pseudovirgaria hyperparasitica]
MIFDAPPNPEAQHARTAVEHAALPQSREVGDAVYPVSSDGSRLGAKPSPFAKSWAHLVAGAAGGMAAATLTAPLDVLKTRLQSTYYQQQLVASRHARGLPPIETMSFTRSSLLHVRETFQILFAVPRAEGWRALFKGLGPNLIGVVPARAINFYVYGNSKNLISAHFNGGKETAWVHVCSAASAGLATGTATNPIWLVKTRLQLDKANARVTGGRQYQNALDCTLQTVRTEGIKGLYRGLTASYLGVAESTMQWVLYEQGKLYLEERQERQERSGKARTAWDDTVSWTGQLFVAGGAKFVAALVTYPHEVVRTRLRLAPTENGQIKYTGLVQCFKLIFKEEGMASLYGGLVPHMLRVVPSAAIMFGTYESVLKLLGSTSKV